MGAGPFWDPSWKPPDGELHCNLPSVLIEVAHDHDPTCGEVLQQIVNGEQNAPDRVFCVLPALWC